ncbi:MAG: trehalase family glycosidase, partial [Candidatus Saccharimonadales bacterium]
FYPLWAGLATKEQARQSVRALGWFENNGGLANTQKGGLHSYRIYAVGARSLRAAHRRSTSALSVFLNYFRMGRSIVSLPQRQLGLPGSNMSSKRRIFKQWDYPNGWAPQQYIVTSGLLRYGYRDDARRLAKKWLDLNKKVFQRTGLFWEKYNVVDGDIGKEGRYPSQTGFGWTNAVFVKLVKEFS